MKYKLLFVLLFASLFVAAQTKPFRFAFVSDTHVGSPSGAAEEDLRRTVADINSMKDVEFVIISGDITELGTNKQLALAKKILDSLNIPYYIIPGNHDTGWSESGGLGFTKTFGDDKFIFKHNGINFIGCASGPYVRMSDGHVPRSNMNWLQDQLKKIDKNEPVIFINHYPLDNGLDNWYEVIDMLKTKNTVLALCGHGHNNRPVQAEEIPARMGRSNLRAKAAEGGYNLVDVTVDSIVFTERKPVTHAERQWTAVALKNQHYDRSKQFPRPDFSINKKYNVAPAWTYSSAANVISTPAVVNNQLVVFGNQNGLVEALDLTTGKRKWKYQTNGPIFSSPAVFNGNIILGSADGNVYSLSKTGKLNWKLATTTAVLGAPLVHDGVVYIGGSDHHFRAINAATGKEIWNYDGLQGPITGKPVVADGVVFVGAWDTYLYAFSLANKELLWKWSNGSSVINYSPAACTPVVHKGIVYVVAPDRYLSAIDANSGKTLWRTNASTVRESIGISEDGKMVYGKTMQDTLAAFYTNTTAPQPAWKMFVGYGYEHAPSMLIECNGKIFFGTRSGVVYAIDAAEQKITWAYKIDNSMVNTVQVLNDKSIIAATMDGKVCLLRTD
jgi:outer membrane protein assembly factor BamB/Icc-related predicted phosphoesterase